MTELRCQEVEELLLDYVEGELIAPRQAEVERHLRGCTACAGEQRRIETLRQALREDEPPDPGAAFWRSFPDRVWHAYQTEINRIDAVPAGWGARLRRALAPLEDLFAAPRWVPVAAALVLAVGVGYFVLHAPAPGLDAAAYQARIRSDQNLAALAREAAVELPPPAQFGFAASEGVNYFRLGHWYAEALAYTAGGDTDAARARLDAMTTALTGTAPRLAEQLRGQPSVADLAALEPKLLRVARSRSDRDEVLFRTGVWLANLALAAAAGDAAALRTAAPRLLDLARELEAAQVAPGARRNLHELAELIARDALSEQDRANVRRLVRRVQTVLL